MDYEEYKKDFLANVKIAGLEISDFGRSIGFTNAFTEKVAGELIDLGFLEDFNSCFYDGRYGRKSIRIDGYSYREMDHVLSLIVTNVDKGKNGDNNQILSMSQINSYDSMLENLFLALNDEEFTENLEPSLPLYDLVELINDDGCKIKKLEFLIFTDRRVTRTAKKIELKKINRIPREIQVWSLERIFKNSIAGQDIERIVVDFRKYEGFENGLPVLNAEIGKPKNRRQKELQTYLGVMPGEVLYQIYDHYGSRLLEENVRSFLSTKVAVNKRIRGTILKEPKMFFAYNNGISVVATSAKTKVIDGQLYLISAEDFQIVNGGQTTASIFNAGYKDKADLSSVFVQMKLTSLGNTNQETEEKEELIKNISKSSNSQNKVNDADFFASHPFHRRMERISRKTFAPAAQGNQYETKWFYERARGQYLQEQMKLTPAKRKEFQMMNPKGQVIKKIDLAKVQNVWRGFPQTASKGAQTNFMKFAEYIDSEWNKNSEIFNQQYFQETAALIIIFKYLEYNIPKQTFWYKGGYRANIIYYTVALLRHLISQQFPGYDLDLQKIWKRQQLSQSLAVELLNVAPKVLKEIESENRVTANVTQWCKRDECWNRVKRISHRLNGNLAADLISIKKVQEQENLAKKYQSFENEKEAIDLVSEIKSSYWIKLKKFLESQEMLRISDVDLFKAARSASKKKLTAGQSRRLLYLKKEAEEAGFQE